MTEQEKRKNAIDEIFEVITEWANKALVKSYAGASVLNIHNALELSKKIYTLFAHKEEEVRKETAKEFALELISYLKTQQDRYDKCIDQRIRDLSTFRENDTREREYTIRCEGKENGAWCMSDKTIGFVRRVLKEKFCVEVEE